MNCFKEEISTLLESVENLSALRIFVLNMRVTHSREKKFNHFVPCEKL